MRRFKMTADALENYGNEYKNVILVATHKANKYMESSEFFATGKPSGYHPGYDKTMNGMPLYDLKRTDTDEDLPFSLYAYELETV